MGVRNRNLKLKNFAIPSAIVLLGSIGTWFFIDKTVAEIYKRIGPKIQIELSKILGQQLELGKYSGLRMWGISIGPTQFMANEQNLSKGEFKEITIKFAPIASLLKWRPVAIFNPKGTKVILRKNLKGLYWSPKQASNKKSAKKIDLHFLVKEPANILLEEENISLKFKGHSLVQLLEKRAYGNFNFITSDKGSLSFNGKANWDRLDLHGKLRIGNLKLDSLNPLLEGITPSKAKGDLDGNMFISVREGLFDCSGRLQLTKFSLYQGSSKNIISTDSTSVLCNKRKLQLNNSKWNLGPLVADLNIDLPLGQKSNLILDIASTVRLKDVSSAELNIKGELPLFISKRKLNFGELIARLNLDSLPLASLSSFINNEIAGKLSLDGTIKGYLSSLKSNFAVRLLNPQVNGIRLQEEWKGNFLGLPEGGGDIKMSSIGAAVPGKLSARFSSDWSLNELTLNRLGGRILVSAVKSISGGKTNKYLWKVDNFRLDRVEISTPGSEGFKRIFGELAGDGSFDISPFKIKGLMKIRYARFMGFRLSEAKFEGDYLNRKYSVNGSFSPTDKGIISFNAEGILGGRIFVNAQATSVSPRWIASTALQIPKINLNNFKNESQTIDLGSLLVEKMGSSIDDSLKILSESQFSLRKDSQLKSKSNLINPNDLFGEIDAFVELKGPNINNLDLELKASGKVSTLVNQKEINSSTKPFNLVLRGPLNKGFGEFSLSDIPLSLFSLIIPIPPSLIGLFAVSGRYRIGKEFTEIVAELALKDAMLQKKEFFLEKGKVSFKDSLFKIDISLRSKTSLEPITLIGQIPLSPSLPIDIRLESHDDGLKFLDGLSNGSVVWNKGFADLRLLVRGTLKDPQANGYLLVKEGEFVVMDKSFDNLNSSILFDFNRLEVQKFKADISSEGSIISEGSISLLGNKLEESKPLNIVMNKFPFKNDSADIELASNMIVKGSLINPKLGGEITIKEGFISPQRSGSSKKNSTRNKNNLSPTLSLKNISFPEESWDLGTPLVLFVQDSESAASKMISKATPKYNFIEFQNLRLRLGPNLRIASQPLANFDVSGLVTLNGSFDETLKPQGVIRLIKGRVNLFTTTFDLDRREPNVAVFTPSMGLVPYVDVKMTSRVPDTVRDENNLASSSDFATNGAGAFGIGGSRFVNVEVTATGPADRISDNFQLRSNPPMPRNQLLGLIGGNSLSRLLGGGEKEVLANVLSQSLISPVLGNITGAFSNRIQLSLYPAYIASPKTFDETADNQTADNEEVGSSLLPRQAWVTEMGLDLTKRFNFSLQATPNRKDIPPQGTLSFQVNSNLGVLGSLDKNGTWKSQAQLFFRF